MILDFRWYDKENKCWRHVDEMRANHNLIRIKPDGAKEFIHVKANEISICSGQRDCNGNLLYDLDVVWDEGEEEFATVSWDEDTSQFTLLYDGWMTDFDHKYGKELELRGTIYDEERRF